ncbi:MAG TPA: allophanate hydrolase [Gammaproteobacteria bacterium]|nr:allophanate hydrolase [Gammaproteobacteria bacterium]
MTTTLKIIAPGMLCSLQDQGRAGYGQFGVPRSGATDPVALRLGNALVGNAPFEAGIEFRMVGPTLQAQGGAVRVGLACQARAEHSCAQTQAVTPVSAWQSITLQPGDTLKVSSVSRGATGYLTLAGGIACEPVLGGISTYARANLGGLHGQWLKANDVIPLRSDAPAHGCEKIIAAPPDASVTQLSVILGPQADFFSTSAREKFLASTFIASTQTDRMGIRLQGDPIHALPDKGNDLISEGLVPGAIQIPGDGQPIVLGVDCQTVGGYPKIATVISADLHKLGQIQPGDTLRFKAVTLAEAQQQRQALERRIAEALSTLYDHYGAGAMNLKALYESNLIDGVVNATSDPTPNETESCKKPST